jgi:hypothetical protein
MNNSNNKQTALVAITTWRWQNIQYRIALSLESGSAMDEENRERKRTEEAKEEIRGDGEERYHGLG